MFMKKILLVLLLINSAVTSAQEYGSDWPKANVSRTLSNDTISYTFKSNYIIDTYKAPLLEKRFLDRYSEIISISIDYDTQVITVKLINENASIFLEKLITHFRYKGYEIN